MSTSEEEDRKEIEKGEPVARHVNETVHRDEPIEREERVYHRRTNTGAIVSIVIGILILLFGLYLVFTQVQFLSPPYSYVAILIIGIVLVAIGAKLISTRAL
ncbi:MAG: hypothetical protein ACYCQJ_05440 [Nitrososphaerales archaeon]